MEGNTLSSFLLVSILGIVFANPIEPGMNPGRLDTSNIPKCMQPPESGLCLAYFNMYYYVPSKNTCETFIYGGCHGNDNRFISFDQCMTECGGFEATTQVFTLRTESEEDKSESVKEDSASAEGNVCSLPPVQGSCRAAMPRFYFNGDDCESFIYGGCEGNENNFRSVEECRQRCGSISSQENETSAENAASSEDSESNEAEE